MTHKLARIGTAVLLALISSQSGGYELLESRWLAPEATFFVQIKHAQEGFDSPSGMLWNDAFKIAAELWHQDTVFRFQVFSNTPANPCRNGLTADGRNGVDFVADSCGGVGFGSTTLALTYNTTSVNDFRTTTESDIVFIEDWNWDVYSGQHPGNVYDFVRIATHELGHTIGLGHESFKPALMHPIAGHIEVPLQDDINGVAALYGSDSDGIPDRWDNCPDKANQNQADNDGDGLGDACDDDDDNDGMSDRYENNNGFNRLNSKDADKDADGDGYTNLEEYLGNSDPNNPKSVPRPRSLPFLVPLLLDDQDP